MFVSYPAFFHKEGERYWVEFPDLSGCVTEGDTVEEAINYASEALGMYLCCLMDDGDEIPAPSAINDHLNEVDDGFVSLVVTDPYRYKKDNKAVKKTLTIPAWLNKEAEKRGVNFSAVLQKALIATLQ